MENTKILEADYLDLIFDKRNKAYGSYELRKHYGRRTLKALGITMALIAGGIAAPFILSELHAKTPAELRPEEKIIPGVILKDVEPPTPPKPPAPPPPPPPSPEPPAPKPVGASVKNLPPVIVPPDRVKPEDLPPTADELKDKLSAAADNPGKPGGIAPALSTENPEATGNGKPSPAGHKGGLDDKNDGIFRTVEQMPEFPGGQKALMEFIRRNLRYPKSAVEQEIQGNVQVAFVVNAQGVIENIKLLRGIGGGCNEEAIRVVGAMPKWKPGRQNGQLVKVSYIIPIAFRLMQ